MPGERILLADDPSGHLRKLLHALAALEDLSLDDHALVGGLAVMCRLRVAHRATEDVDEVAGSTTPSLIEVIVAQLDARRDPGGSTAWIDGIAIDVIDTDPIVEGDLEGLELAEQLFVTSHRWALQSATPVTLECAGSSVTSRVAQTPALVATKVSAILGARRRLPHKRASDVFDLYRLVQEHDRYGGLSRALLDAPLGIGALVGAGLTASVVEQSERTARLLSAGNAEMSAIGRLDLLEVIAPLAGFLHRDQRFER